MAATFSTEPDGPTSQAAGSSFASTPALGAATAAERVWNASLLLGLVGLTTSALAIARVFLTWRVTPHTASHHITLVGYRLSYPVANLDAVVVLALALAGLVVAARAVWGAAREVAAAAAFQRRLAAQAPRPLPNGALVIPDERPQAFCAGLFRPRVYLTSGALTLLDEDALGAVLAHETHHARRRDPLRLAVGRVLARALFFVPGLAALVRHEQDLAELSADESAINAGPGNRSALARAMLAVSESSPTLGSAGIDPRRVDHLLGEPPSWRFPTLMCAAAVGVIGLVGAIALLAGQVAVGSATLAPPFLSHEPCILVLGLIPAGAALGSVGVARRLRRRLRGTAR
jgi:hypothetical protein